MALRTLRLMKGKQCCLRLVVISASRYCHNFNPEQRLSRPWKVMFFGTDDFSINSLKKLNEELKSKKTISRLEVVTSKYHLNPVKLFSLKEDLVIHEWPAIKSSTINDFDIGLVASFGHLIPKKIIDSFPLGMLNVHGSLLPKWRGAAPINYAIMHGDSVTGISIMRIQPHVFDRGDVLSRRQVEIHPEETALQLRNRLSEIGGEELISCVRRLPESLSEACPQSEKGVSYAPKLTADVGILKFEKMSANCIYNRFRALYGLVPLVTTWMGQQLSLHEVTVGETISDRTRSVNTSNIGNATVLQRIETKNCLPGQVQYHRKGKFLLVTCCDNSHLIIQRIAPFRKKPMSAPEFYNGYLSKHKKNFWIFGGE